MKQDALNTKIGVPEMSDFYYDVPDQSVFLSNMGKQINPTKGDMSSAAVKAKFYMEDPPQSGYDDKKEIAVFDIILKEKGISDNDESVAGIKIDDGDTIKIPLDQVKCPDAGTKKYIDAMQAYTAEHGKDGGTGALTLRFAGLDCKELPHYQKVNKSDVKEKFVYATLDEALKNPDCVVSKYKSFMQSRETISKTYTGDDVKNSTFFDYSQTYDGDEQLTFIKMEDGKYHQIFDDGESAYILQKNDCNDYKKETIQDAGIARDVVANAINRATEMKVVVDCTKIVRDKSPITTKFRYDPSSDDWENTSYKKTLDSLFDESTQYKKAGFNYWGQDAYGRCIAAIYVKIDGKWINLNKMVVADTKQTDVNKYNSPGDSSSGVDTGSYNFDNKKYVDDLYSVTKIFDDRDTVHAELFKALGKEQNWEKLKQWTVVIGDVVLIVPPTAIRVLSQTKADRMPVVRAKGAMAKSATKIQHIIEMDLYFNEDRGINGIEYKTNTHPDGSGKNITYYMNGLRALYSEFRLAPFLPIDNDYINMGLGIDAVTMINFSCETVPNFPKLLKATLQLSEFEYRIYMPEIPYDEGDDDDKKIRNYFSEQINYPLFRYYYQRPLINGEKLKKVNFIDNKFIESTLGNKTNLIPASFVTPNIKFYIPDRDNLEKLKQAKISRLTQPNTVRNISKKELKCAGELAKIDNEIKYLNSDAESGINKLNAMLQSSEFEGCRLSLATNSIIVTDSSGMYNKEKTEKVTSALATITDTYDNSLSELKKSDGKALCPEQGSSKFFKTEDNSGGIKQGITLSKHVDVSEMTDDELNSLKTLSTVSGKYSADEVFNDRNINISVSIYGLKENGDIELGKEDGDYFHFDDTNETQFMKFCGAVNDQGGVGGNEEANNAKAVIDYVDANTIKWIPYNEDQDFRVESIHMNTSNSFSQITIQETNGYAPQYMGGTDITLNISMYTSSLLAASAMDALPGMAAQYAREYKLVLAAWPLRIESEFTKLFGITEVMVEAVEVDTVPNYPGLYHVNLSLVSVDRTLRNREALKKKDMQNFHNLSIAGVTQERQWSYTQMSKFLSSAELYPDLELPTLQELEEAGFSFIHYSNKDRVYPDPDFYFTYSYVLMSQLIREAVLNSLSNNPTMTIGDSTGKKATGGILNSISTWNAPWVKTQADYIKAVKNVGNEYKTDKNTIARVVTDFMSSKNNERNELWAIAPNVKVALMEKRIANKLNDLKKQEYLESKGIKPDNNTTYNNQNSGNDNPTKTADKQAAETEQKTKDIYANKENNDKNTQEENPNTSGNENAQGKTVVSSNSLQSAGTNDNKDNKTNTEQKKEAASETQKKEDASNSESDSNDKEDTNDSSKKQPAETKEDKAYTSFISKKNQVVYEGTCTYIDSVLNGPVNGKNGNTVNDVLSHFSSYDYSSTELFDAVKLDNSDVDDWLIAAADAICSEGGVEYSDKYSVKKHVPGSHGPWQYAKKYRAKIAAGNSIEQITFTKDDPDYKNKINAVKWNAVEFGYYNFRYYSKEELEDKFGYYGNVDDVPEECARYGCYLADPYYRSRPAQEQYEYIEKCTTDITFAKNAFLRICLLYMKTLMSYNVLPSYSYDIMSDALYKEDVIKKVLSSQMDKEKREANYENAKAQSQKGYGITQKYTKNGDSKTKHETSESGNNQYSETKDTSDNKNREGNSDPTKAKKPSDANNDSSDNSSGDSDNKDKQNPDQTTTSMPSSGGASETNKSNGEITGGESSDANNRIDAAVQEYMKGFKENKKAIDTGKVFLLLATGIVDGNKEFIKTLRNHDYDALNVISEGSKSDTESPNDNAVMYKNPIRRFIRAAVGEGLIDEDDLGLSGTAKSPQSTVLETDSRRNVAAASEDPLQYLPHSFYDMIVHDCRGRMLRAFPTFYMFLVDEGRKIGRWKLHDNFYNVNSVASITISSSRKMPMDTAEVIMSNFFNTYTTDDEDLNAGYSTNFTDVFNSLWLPTLKSYAESEEERRTDALSVERFRLRPGARIYIRLGYGADASHLPESFNGVIAELETGDTVKLICQSDGGELCKPVVINGVDYASDVQGVDQFIGTKAMGENGDTPKHILRSLLCMKGGFINSWMHEKNWDDLANSFGDPLNPLGIYHFGNPDITYATEPEPIQNIFEAGLEDSSNRYLGTENTGKKGALSEDLSIAGDVAFATGTAAAATGVGLPVTAASFAIGAGAKSASTLIDAFSSPEEAPMIQFELNNKSLWDIACICKSIEPDYYVGVRPFHMRSTLFMGRSHDYYAYDYGFVGGTMVEKRKPFQQFHIYTSFTDIINNGIAVSTKDIKTCAVGMYEVSGFAGAKVSKKTDAQWVDRNIYPEYQKTSYVDTKLFGQPSRQLGALSDVVNFFFGGITNSTFDRACDEKGKVRNHHATAVKMTIDALKDGMKGMYQGQLTIIGDPSVMPQDRMLINDSYNSITGQCLVRNVVQVFSTEDGYKTVLTPDLITAQVGNPAQGELKRTSYGDMANMGVNVIGIKTSMYLKNKTTTKLGRLCTWTKSTKSAELASKKLSAIKEAASKTTANALEKAAENHKAVGKLIGTLKNVGSTAGTVGSSAVKLGAKAITKLAGPIGLVVGTVGLGIAEDMLMSSVTSRKRLVVFPLQKYGRPMVGGMDGSVGTIYGAPNFDTSDGFQSMFKNVFSNPLLKGIVEALYGDGGVYQLNQAAGMKGQEKIANIEGQYQQSLSDVNKSNINGITKTHYNPAMPRLNVRKTKDRQKALSAYGITGNTESTINSDKNMDKMVIVFNDDFLKKYISLGFFRIAGHEKGFTKDLSDKIECLYLKNPGSAGSSIPINALKYDNGSYDIPYLNKEAIGVLKDIISNALTFLAGAEQSRDPMKWYEDNGSSFVTLTSALKCGSKDGYECTGLSFVLTCSDDKTRVAVQQALDYLQDNQTKTKQTNSSVQEKSFEYQQEGSNMKVLVYPPATGE